eukprot:CAMPEP_0174720144 /NCGR_PEP_ID=MMETSP1094-20130205/32892_1 /TAXON_ID=156173 /ORGANISM="Chrysochromulina brevifilum, Strain UTEX LB 985" /LENGTH=137 /DNA_ID=CAMNT_0015920591 /DNA_START=125 /DNA_END=537 /DNA_ORIENTATION=+
MAQSVAQKSVARPGPQVLAQQLRGAFGPSAAEPFACAPHPARHSLLRGDEFALLGVELIIARLLLRMREAPHKSEDKSANGALRNHLDAERPGLARELRSLATAIAHAKLAQDDCSERVIPNIASNEWACDSQQDDT